GADTLTKVFKRFCAGQIHGEPLKAGAGQMKMGIIESWHDEAPFEFNDLGMRALEFQNIRHFADRSDAIARHCDRLCAFALEGAPAREAGIDVSVQKNLVCFPRRFVSNQNGGAQQKQAHSNHPQPPASTSNISRMRFSPVSRPLHSNHSCSVWAPPPKPPPPIAIASRPMESGILASVEARCTCAELPRNVSTARTARRIRELGSSSPAGRSPMRTISRLSPDFLAPGRCSAACRSSLRTRSAERRRASSSFSSSSPDVERRSTLMLADSGMEFTEVPPRITPTLKVVFGVAGTAVCTNW